jgi:flagellar biosynthesis/type III secretory pathway protein FliH
MSSPDFAPLVKGPARRTEFQPLGTPAPAEPTTDPAPPPASTAVPDVVAERAFDQGYARGREEAQAELASVAAAFARALHELASFRAGLRARYERELLELALGVARKVVQQELVAHPEIWLEMIRAAVHRAVDRERITIRVPAPLLDFLRRALPELRAGLDEVKELALVEDPALPPNGCVIESRFGEVDIGVETQLEAIERALVRVQEDI